jgi:hypothetical protein
MDLSDGGNKPAPRGSVPGAGPETHLLGGGPKSGGGGMSGA